MVTLPKYKSVIFPSLEIGVEQIDRIALNFHARINGFFLKNQVHEIRTVVECACQACGVEIDVFYTSSRKREVVLSRMLVIVYAISNYRWGLAKTGQHVGGKDHATVLSLHRRYTDFSEIKDPDLMEAKTTFIELLKQRNETLSVLMLPYQRKINK